jgi:hypothetical protein
MEVGLQIEVAGCPTICKHCWAQGVPYAAMPLEEIDRLLEQVGQFCTKKGMKFSAFPMHEVVAHPNAPEVLSLFRRRLGVDPGFEPLATTGVPIAMREDWAEFLAAIGVTGTTTFWVAFHGFEAGHDRLVMREGAFSETCLAVRRIRAAGFRCGANVFVTKNVVTHFAALTQVLQEIGLKEMSWEPPNYFPTARARQYEAQRAELAELLPLAEQIGTLTGFWKEKWAKLEEHTEAHWRQRALKGDWPPAWQPSAHIALVCRSNFDLHTGSAGLYGQRHGNLKRDNLEETLERAVVAGYVPQEQLYLRTVTFPTVAELAKQAGDEQGQTIHFASESMRYYWLDRMAGRMQPAT